MNSLKKYFFTAQMFSLTGLQMHYDCLIFYLNLFASLFLSVEKRRDYNAGKQSNGA